MLLNWMSGDDRRDRPSQENSDHQRSPAPSAISGAGDPRRVKDQCSGRFIGRGFGSRSWLLSEWPWMGCSASTWSRSAWASRSASRSSWFWSNEACQADLQASYAGDRRTMFSRSWACRVPGAPTKWNPKVSLSSSTSSITAKASLIQFDVGPITAGKKATSSPTPNGGPGGGNGGVLPAASPVVAGYRVVSRNPRTNARQGLSAGR